MNLRHVAALHQEHGGLLVLRGLEELTAGQGDLMMKRSPSLTIEQWKTNCLLFRGFVGDEIMPGYVVGIMINH